ncbi:MAG: hypothetical protein ACJ73D_07210 [Pyrinomonadaceae bacterium]
MIRTKYLSLLVAAGLCAAACQKAANTSNNGTSTSNVTVTSAANTSANSSSAAKDATANDPGNFNGSPTEVYKAAYTARKNCDIDGLKKVMAKDLLGYMDKMAKVDKKSTDEELKELCSTPQASTEQARNEKIDGDHASIEYLDEENKWERMDFVREDGVWKMSIGAPGEAPPDLKDDKDDNRS